MLPPLSFLLALALDLLSLRALLGDGFWPADPAVEALGFHAGALGLALVAFFGTFPAPYRQAAPTLMALVFGLCGPLPLVGLLFLGAFRLLFRLRPAGFPEKKYVFGGRQVMTADDFDDTLAAMPLSVLEILRGSDIARRRSAVLALRAVDARKAIPILQRAIQDSDEQVRLLAQAQLNRIVTSLEAQLKSREAELAAGPRTPAKLLPLAELYHELVYLGLSSDETRSLNLQRAIELVTEALEQAPDLRPARFLLLKCHLKMRNVPAAREALAALKRAGFDAELLDPWEAEIVFLERDWIALERLLTGMERRPSTDPRLRGLLEFWLQPRSSA